MCIRLTRACAVELLFAQTEEYVEYTPSGAVATGRERAVAKSKYEEDVLTHNHTAVWGSFFDRATLRWGYADDHATIRNAFGTGEAGKQARAMAAANMQRALESQQQMQASMAAGMAAGGGGGGGGGGGAGSSSGGGALPQTAMFGTGEQLEEAALDEAKVREAMAKEKRRAREKDESHDDRKRKYNSFASTETTAEEMEAYHRMKGRGMEDPMAKMLAADPEAVTDDEA